MNDHDGPPFDDVRMRGFAHRHAYRIADANGPMLVALVERDGGLVDSPRVVPTSQTRSGVRFTKKPT